MQNFQPDSQHVIDAALNREAERLPLYEHGFASNVVEAVIGEQVEPLMNGSYDDRVEAQRRVCRCGVQLGYDCIPFERHVTELVQHGEGLKGHATSIIQNMSDLQAFPWETKASDFIEMFQQDYDALREALPEGMQAVGGIGNGLFETMQDFVPYQELALLMMDEPEVCAQLWQRVGDLMVELWTWLLENHADSFAVLRFGDDLGFRSSTLLQPQDIREHIIPQYKRVIDLVHAHDKPFLLHSCGKIYDVMEDLIAIGIDAKHSNEDAIDVFDVWVEEYGDRIGNFGGVEMNIMTVNTPEEVKAYVHDLLDRIASHNGGIAIGTGNQISPYTEPANWIAMTQAVREWRGD